MFEEILEICKRNCTQNSNSSVTSLSYSIMLISHEKFYINNLTKTLCSVDVLVFVNDNTNDPSINIFDKAFNFTFYNGNKLLNEVKKY